ncbi:hypothetical protein DXA98_00060 [Lachnospiraceae bacterium OF09-6]|nr:hypothetical protein DXA98_00060 [Lachnospiraceae bacterium OF09-6]
MPGAGKNKDLQSVQLLYDRFLKKSLEMLEKDGVIVAYTTLPDVLEKATRKYQEYRILKEEVINERENSRLVIIQRL